MRVAQVGIEMYCFNQVDGSEEERPEGERSHPWRGSATTHVRISFRFKPSQPLSRICWHHCNIVSKSRQSLDEDGIEKGYSTG